MKKIPTIFLRNPDRRHLVLAEVNPECHWVFSGEGVATRKYDGTCCMILGGVLYKRREVKKGKEIPEGFVQKGFDVVTGKAVGWVSVDLQAKENKWHAEAFSPDLPDGTYELLGPKVQGNPEGVGTHYLKAHATATELPDCPRSFEGLRDWFSGLDIEGVVWHHPDGRMAKIKLRDFGLKRTSSPN